MKMSVNSVGQGSLWLAFRWKPVSEGLRRGDISELVHHWDVWGVRIWMPPTGGTGLKPTLSDDPLEERSPRSRRLGGASKSVHRCNAWGLYKSGRHPSEGARGFERPTGTGRPGSSDFLVSLDKKGDLEWLLSVE